MNQGDNHLQWLPDDFNGDWTILDDLWGDRYLEAEAATFDQTPTLYNQPTTTTLQLPTAVFSTYDDVIQPWLNPSAPEINFSLLDHISLEQMSYLSSAPSELSDEPVQGFATLQRNNHEFSLHSEATSSEVMTLQSSSPGTGSEQHLARPQEGDACFDEQVPRNKKGTGNAKPKKKRLPCQYSSCKRSFPRKYELERHQSNVHQKKLAFYCFVYGCNRVSKPFPRLDKFQEHVRTRHKSPENFLCVFEDCHEGPLTLAQFKDHTAHQHNNPTSQEAHINSILKTLNLRRVPSTPGSVRLGNWNDCPLAFLGCDFRFENSDIYNGDLSSHLKTHDLLERSKGYEAIESVITYWLYKGTAHCPVCEERWSFTSVWTVTEHVGAHSKESRAPHLAELSEMFRPLLLMNSSWGWTHKMKVAKATIQAEIEEAGMMPVAPS